MEVLRGPTRGRTAAAIVAAIALAVTLGAATTCGEAAAAEAGGTESLEAQARSPILLMFHSGAFVFGSTESLTEAAATARDVGFRPVLVDYPLGDLPRAVSTSARTAKRYMRSGRRVYAYGESAGGTLAALLAERGLVRAAGSYSQVTDLPAYVRSAPDPDLYREYLGATDRQIRRASPARGTTDLPFLAITGRTDFAGFAAATRAWARANPTVRARIVPGGHSGDEAGSETYSTNVRLVLEWLDARAQKRMG
jgi:acetyl esterase/lipase